MALKNKQVLTPKNKMKFLDLYRVIGMILVMLGHFVGTGAYARSIPNVINEALEKPLLNPENFVLLRAQDFLYYRFGVQTARVGVVIFFLSTGYLIAGMMERYSPLEFLVNRILRIIPCLAASVLLCGIVLHFSQGFHFSFAQYITSMTMTYPVFQVAPFLGVLWTLVIEILFYILASIVRKFNFKIIIGLYGIVLLTGLLEYEYPLMPRIHQLNTDAKYLVFCLQGALIWVLENNSKPKTGESILLAISLAANIIIFKINQSIFEDDTTYPHFFTHVFPLLLFLLLRWSEQKLPIAYRHFKVITWAASLVFPVYLTHVVIGFNTMYYLRYALSSRTLLVVVAMFISLAVGWVLSMIIEKPSVRLTHMLVNRIRMRKTQIDGI